MAAAAAATAAAEAAAAIVPGSGGRNRGFDASGRNGQNGDESGQNGDESGQNDNVGGSSRPLRSPPYAGTAQAVTACGGGSGGVRAPPDVAVLIVFVAVLAAFVAIFGYYLLWITIFYEQPLCMCMRACVRTCIRELSAPLTLIFLPCPFSYPLVGRSSVDNI